MRVIDVNIFCLVIIIMIIIMILIIIIIIIIIVIIISLILLISILQLLLFIIIICYCILLWQAFELYVLPILMYLSPAWSPKLKRDIDSLEKVQRRYTKLICNLRNLPYKERLRELSALSLSNRRIYADMIFIYKCLHDNINFPTSDFGLVLVASTTRGCGCRLRQRIANNKSVNMFNVRAVSA